MLGHVCSTRNDLKWTIQVFPKVDQSANVARIVSVEHTIRSVVDLIFW